MHSLESEFCVCVCTSSYRKRNCWPAQALRARVLCWAPEARGTLHQALSHVQLTGLLGPFPAPAGSWGSSPDLPAITGPGPTRARDSQSPRGLSVAPAFHQTLFSCNWVDGAKVPGSFTQAWPLVPEPPPPHTGSCPGRVLFKPRMAEATDEVPRSPTVGTEGSL